jgi:hypothetical protein
LLGALAIDAVGDPIPAPVTIVRLEHGGGTNVVASYEGARVDSVITPRPRLLGKRGRRTLIALGARAVLYRSLAEFSRCFIVPDQPLRP